VGRSRHSSRLLANALLWGGGGRGIIGRLARSTARKPFSLKNRVDGSEADLQLDARVVVVR
jgi:hypothetical protein